MATATFHKISAFALLLVFLYYFHEILLVYDELSTEMQLMNPEEYRLPILVICLKVKFRQKHREHFGTESLFDRFDMQRDGQPIGYRLAPFEYTFERICARIAFDERVQTCRPFDVFHLLMRDLYYVKDVNASLTRDTIVISNEPVTGHLDRSYRIYALRRPAHLSRARQADEVCRGGGCVRELFILESVWPNQSPNRSRVEFNKPVVLIDVHQSMTVDVLLIYVLYLFGSCFGVDFVLLQFSLKGIWKSGRFSAKPAWILTMSIALAMVVTQSSRMQRDYLKHEAVGHLRYRISSDIHPLNVSVCVFSWAKRLAPCLSGKAGEVDLNECGRAIRRNLTLAEYWAEAREQWPTLSRLESIRFEQIDMYTKDELACFTLNRRSAQLASLYTHFERDAHPFHRPQSNKTCVIFHTADDIARSGQSCIQNMVENYFPIFLERRLSAPDGKRCEDYRRSRFKSQMHCIESCVLKRFRRKHGKLPTFVSYDSSAIEHRRLQNWSFQVVTGDEERAFTGRCRLKCPLAGCTRLSYPESDGQYLKTKKNFMPIFYIFHEITYTVKLELFELFVFIFGVVNFWFGVSFHLLVLAGSKAARRLFNRLTRWTLLAAVYLACFWMLCTVFVEYQTQRSHTEVRFVAIERIEIPTFVICISYSHHPKTQLSKLPPLVAIRKVYWFYLEYLNSSGLLQRYDFTEPSPVVKVTFYPKSRKEYCLKLAFNLTYRPADLSKGVYLVSLRSVKSLTQNMVSIIQKDRYQDKTFFIYRRCQEFFFMTFRFESGRGCRRYRHSRLDDLYLAMQLEYIRRTEQIASALPLFELHERFAVDHSADQIQALHEIHERVQHAYQAPDCESRHYFMHQLSNFCFVDLHFQASRFEILVLIKESISFPEALMRILGIFSICVNLSLKETVEFAFQLFVCLKRRLGAACVGQIRRRTEVPHWSRFAKIMKFTRK